MASVKIVLREKKEEHSTRSTRHPLYIRITHKRSTAFVYLGHTVTREQWDANKSQVKKSHPNSKRINSFLLQKTVEADKVILDFELQKKSFSAKMVKEALSDQTKSSSVLAFADAYFQTLIEAGNYNRWTAERPAMNHFKRFLKQKDITFTEVSITLLEQYRAYLRGSVKVSERTVANYLIIIRTLYKKAIKSGIAAENDYPFGRDKFLVKKPESQKIGLEKVEVELLEAVQLEKCFEHHARNLWLFSFYFAGIRVSDVLQMRWSDIKNDRLYYVMQKNSKPVSLKVPQKALRILEEYRAERRTINDLIFPDLKLIEDFNDTIRVQKRIKEVTRRINKALREVAVQANIEKKLTMHIARHTFGNISGDSIPIHMLQQLFKHSSVTTTANYMKHFMYQEMDDALSKVVG